MRTLPKLNPLAVAAVILALVGVVLLAWPASPRPQTHQTAPSPTASAPAAVTATGQPSVHPPTGTPEQLAAARAFAVAYTSPVPQDAWLAALKPTVTTDLVQGFAYTDPRLRPTGTLEKITPAAGGAFTVTYKGGTAVTVTLEAVGAGWLVNSVAPVAPPVPTGNDVGGTVGS